MNRVPFFPDNSVRRMGGGRNRLFAVPGKEDKAMVNGCYVFGWATFDWGRERYVLEVRILIIIWWRDNFRLEEGKITLDGGIIIIYIG